MPRRANLTAGVMCPGLVAMEWRNTRHWGGLDATIVMLGSHLGDFRIYTQTYDLLFNVFGLLCVAN